MYGFKGLAGLGVQGFNGSGLSRLGDLEVECLGLTA